MKCVTRPPPTRATDPPIAALETATTTGPQPRHASSQRAVLAIAQVPGLLQTACVGQLSVSGPLASPTGPTVARAPLASTRASHAPLWHLWAPRRSAPRVVQLTNASQPPVTRPRDRESGPQPRPLPQLVYRVGGPYRLTTRAPHCRVIQSRSPRNRITRDDASTRPINKTTEPVFPPPSQTRPPQSNQLAP